MDRILTGAKVYRDGAFYDGDVCDAGGKLCGSFKRTGQKVIDLSGCFIFPAFSDVHVHLREPGFFYKESIKTGTQAAAHGGYAAVCSMPNLDPVPDCAENLKVQLDIIEKTAEVAVYPYASITKGENGLELSDFSGLYKDAVAFSDDGRGVQSAQMMRSAMEQARKYDKIIAAHCEDNSLLKGGYIHDGRYARVHDHKGICSESEWRQIERDLRLAKETGCKYHVCHISAKESVELIRQAKKDGVDVTCETAPHYLVFSDMDLEEDGRFKMNPPIRSEKDRYALIEGIKDGTIDMIATDHAPHSQEEKSHGLKGSLMGVVGLETAFAALYTHLVKPGIISLERLVELMAVNPAKRFGLKYGYENGNYTIFNLNKSYVVDPYEFYSKGRSTPFAGQKLFGVCRLTAVGGKAVYKDASMREEW